MSCPANRLRFWTIKVSAKIIEVLLSQHFGHWHLSLVVSGRNTPRTSPQKRTKKKLRVPQIHRCALKSFAEDYEGRVAGRRGSWSFAMALRTSVLHSSEPPFTHLPWEYRLLPSASRSPRFCGYDDPTPKSSFRLEENLTNQSPGSSQIMSPPSSCIPQLSAPPVRYRTCY
ncbi:hypothetical protein BDN72DRAFT_850512 [Pluteus cervinus]|uniref:Uncharacterized protein n=1 Tax=Pluteus cervinus TaxID=181527 RepID=A0ACD3A3K8_9AGAR|nr:hypothetical protein BDN72DRAFT_850512 [Pluteus cervinus]